MNSLQNYRTENGVRVLGVARIQRIDTQLGTKRRQRCLECRTTALRHGQRSSTPARGAQFPLRLAILLGSWRQLSVGARKRVKNTVAKVLPAES